MISPLDKKTAINHSNMSLVFGQVSSYLM